MASLETLEPLISPIDSLSDNELVQAAAAGDEHAFEAIFERHRKLVARLAGRFFHQRDEVEEIIQISFAEAYFALKAFQGARENSFVHWLSRITVNTCYDALRRAQRRPELTFSNLTEEQTEWLQRYLSDEKAEANVEATTILRDLVSKLLTRLGPEDRVVLTLLEMDGMSVRDVADLTGWSVAKVKIRAHRARLALRRVLRKFV